MRTKELVASPASPGRLRSARAGNKRRVVMLRQRPHEALLFAGPRGGEEPLLEVCDDQWPELITGDCGHYCLGADAATQGRNRDSVYRWCPPTTKPATEVETARW